MLRTRLLRWVLGGVFSHMSWALPVKHLRETETLVAFYHPVPSYPVHILLVPKRAIASLSELDYYQRQFVERFLTDVLNCTVTLVAELKLEQPGYRLIANGGGYQDLPQLHFHLVSG